MTMWPLPPSACSPAVAVIVALAGPARTSVAVRTAALVAAARIEGLSDEDVGLAARPRQPHHVDGTGGAAARGALLPDHDAAVARQRVRLDAGDQARAAVDHVDPVRAG